VEEKIWWRKTHMKRRKCGREKIGEEKHTLKYTMWKRKSGI
jgi:hypothetical protein